MRRGQAVAVLAAMALAACGTQTVPSATQATPQSPPADPAGSYQLVSIDGMALPCTPVDRDRPADAPPAPEVLSAELVLEPGGAFHQTMRLRIRRGEVVRELENPLTGTWAREGAGYLLSWEGAGVTPAQLAADTLTYDNVGMVLKFIRKR